MDSTSKLVPRKRSIVGWRQMARRISENRSWQRTPPPAPVKGR